MNVLTGTLRSITIDGVRIAPESGRVDVATVDSGGTEVYDGGHGTSFPKFTAAEWARSWRAPVDVCGICGCAFHGWGGTCNSCREGRRVAEQQLLSRRLQRACKTLEGACVAFGMSYASAVEAMGNLGPITLRRDPRDASLYHALTAPDPTGWVHDEYFIPAVYCPAPTPVWQVFDEISALPADFPHGCRTVPTFDFFASGLMHQAFGRAARPEPRPKRDKRNRGPVKQREWWRK